MKPEEGDDSCPKRRIERELHGTKIHMASAIYNYNRFLIPVTLFWRSTNSGLGYREWIDALRDILMSISCQNGQVCWEVKNE
jgi:hypothetical protein